MRVKVSRWTIEHNPRAHYPWIGKAYYYDADRSWFRRERWWRNVEGKTREEVADLLAKLIAELEEDNWTVVEERIL